MSSSSGSKKNLLKLVVIRNNGRSKTLANVDVADYNSAEDLHSALLPYYNEACQLYQGNTLLAKLKATDQEFDLTLGSSHLSLLDVCHAAYMPSDSDEEVEEENVPPVTDPHMVHLEIMHGNQIIALAKVDPHQFNGARALRTEVLAQCARVYGQRGSFIISLPEKNMMSRFENDDRSRAYVKRICDSAYE